MQISGATCGMLNTLRYPILVDGYNFPYPILWSVNAFPCGEMFNNSHTDAIDGLVQDCSNSIANALELLQSCPKPS